MTEWVQGFISGAVIVCGICTVLWMWTTLQILRCKTPADKPLWTPETQRMIDETQRMGEEMVKSVEKMRGKKA